MSSGIQPRARVHGIRPLTGRDPNEGERVSSPLELFYDLTYAIAFGVTADQAAHLAAEGHWAGATLGFGFSMFAVIWAWVTFTWFASAFDTDDWLFRLLTMVQMAGVLILTVGLGPLFHTIDTGHALANGTIVLGYVIMRVAQVAQWLRAARDGDDEQRKTSMAYAVGTTGVQLLWVGFWAFHLTGVVVLLIWLALVVIEFAVPRYAETRGRGTPWHPHHVAERYGLLTIIALGECLLGAIAALSAAVEDGWSFDVAVLGAAGTLLAFGLWWIYFILPTGDALARNRSRGFTLGYGHMPIFAAIAAIGAGLHVAADAVTGAAEISTLSVTLAVAVPVAVYTVGLGVISGRLLGWDRGRLAAKGVILLMLLVAVLLAMADAPLTACLGVVALAPLVAIVIDEWFGLSERFQPVA